MPAQASQPFQISLHDRCQQGCPQLFKQLAKICKQPDSDYLVPKAISSRGVWGHAPPGNFYILSPQKRNFPDSEHKFPMMSVQK